ncbi:hypothetical protein [Sinanaerobacter sp. ZZT-01]|uniref:hypothetical protein n=1 Tax=Sinanaerobacter sp. ZZT-01 TaxID=3111540 RepID=UPI002D7767E4|nr:hypothetical protein [Sinanaerobacter sp. ZZT-01]WRR93954.1 hypothetical protein U5921_02190 [Sinanaerobacter sp. ZZT-01]
MNTTSSYYRNLIETVLRYSDATEWKAAVLEWCIDDVEEDETLSESCICGKENLRFLFTIRNTVNGQTLYPIGSSCITKFERSDLDEEVAVKEQLFKLLHAIEDRQFLVLSSDFFSRKLLRYLYDLGAFKPSSYNEYDPYNDYQFMLDMFNKRNRSERQNKRATAIILNSIKPFLQDMLRDKIH